MSADAFSEVMGPARGAEESAHEPLRYDSAPPHYLAAPTRPVITHERLTAQDRPTRHVVLAELPDPDEFVSEVQHAPADVAPDMDSARMSEERDDGVEFYVVADAEEAVRQFQDACDYLGLRPYGISVTLA